MLEWLEVWLDVGFNKKLVHEYRIIIIIIIIIKSTTNWILLCRLSDRSANAARTRESIPPENKTATLVWPQDPAAMQCNDSAANVCNKYPLSF